HHRCGTTWEFRGGIPTGGRLAARGGSAQRGGLPGKECDGQHQCGNGGTDLRPAWMRCTWVVQRGDTRIDGGMKAVEKGASMCVQCPGKEQLLVMRMHLAGLRIGRMLVHHP